MQRTTLAAGMLLASVVFLVARLSGGQADAVERAPAYDPAAAVEEREAATVALARNGRTAVPMLRQIVQTEAEPRVRAAALAGLGDAYDYQSMDTLLEAMTSSSRLERLRAHGAVARMAGLRREIDPDAPLHEWRRAADWYRRIWNNMRDTPALDAFKKKLERRHGELPQ